jgi:hypothetical protein
MAQLPEFSYVLLRNKKQQVYKMSGKVPAILYSLRKSALNPNEYASEIVKTTRTLPKCYSFIYIVVITYSDHDFGVQMTLNYTLQLCVRIHAPVFVNVRPHK